MSPAEKAPVLVSIGLDYSTGGWHDDGPNTLRDDIVRAAVAQLLPELRQALVDEITTEAAQQIREQVTSVIAETLAAPIQTTNRWGDGAGPPTSLRSLIGQEVERYTKGKRESYGGQVTGPFQELVKAEVHRAMEKELRDAIADARRRVQAEVHAKAAQLIADAVKVAGR